MKPTAVQQSDFSGVFFSCLDKVFFNFIIFLQADLSYTLPIVQNTKLSFHSHCRGCCCVRKVFMNVENDTVDVFWFVLTGRARCEYGIWDILSSFERGPYNENNSFYLLYNPCVCDKTLSHTHTSAQIYIISSDCLKTPLFVFLTQK